MSGMPGRLPAQKSTRGVHTGEVIVEHALATFASTLAWHDVPPGVQSFVVDVLLDALANGIVGSVSERADDVARAMGAMGVGKSRVMGSGRSLSPIGAVGQHAFQITAYTMCDVYRPALCHVTPEVLPVLLGVSKAGTTSGADFLAALAVGLEVTTRIGRGLSYREFRRRGFHAPGIIGSIGAAGAASRVLGLDPERVCEAMALAGGCAGGTFAGLGSDAIKVHQVHGALSGFLGAQLATADLRGAQRILTAADGGILATYSDGGTPASIVGGLGSEWELTKLSLRARPGSSSVQSVGECAQEIATHLGSLAASGVDSACVRVPPSAHAMCAAPTWSDQLSALQSAPFVVAIVLSGREWWVEAFGDGLRDDAKISELSKKVEVIADDSIELGGAALEVVQTDGTTTTAVRPCALGDPGHPVTRADVVEKLRRACESAVKRLDPHALVAVVETLEDAAQLTGFFDVLGIGAR